MKKEKNMTFEVKPGNPETLGVVLHSDGINFAAAIPDELEAKLIVTDLNGKEIRRIDLPVSGRTGEVSSVFLTGADPESIAYFYEIDGKHFLDPYAVRIRGEICYPACRSFDWESEKAPCIRTEDLAVYKLHVRGFTKKAGSGVKHRGTFTGLAEKIPYIRDLGFNAVELMPVYEYDDILEVKPFSEAETNAEGKTEARISGNYWGYAEVNRYFAPREKYAATQDASYEFCSMVKAFHDAGIEVILEMYFPPKTDPFLALQAVRHWKSYYHVDGFHFIGEGTPVCWLVSDPLLKKTKLMIERVDPSWYGGNIPKSRHLLEYNSDFEHVGRSLLKGDEGQIGTFSAYIRRNPQTHSYVNYMANVNGFTLFDAVCYDRKHNEANGEGNLDGSDINCSWNCGVEGPSRKKAVRELRLRQIKNALAYVFLAQGVPLLYAGDEMLNSQGGNNNAYSSDDPTGWVDWNSSAAALEVRNFVKKLLEIRKDHKIFHMRRELRGTDYRGLGYPDISFHDSSAWVSEREFMTRTLAVLLGGMYTREENLPEDDFFYIAYNAYWEKHPFALPVLPKSYTWELFLDTGEGTEAKDHAEISDQKYCECPPRSVSVLRGIKI